MNSDGKRLCIVIPCHNEAGCIAEVIGELEHSYPDAALIVVDDASTDNSGEVLRSLNSAGLIVLSLPTNLGIGGAVQTGLRYAAANHFDFAVKFDGDGQHCADEIEKILSPVQVGEADVVIGSRFLTKNLGFKSTFMRRLGIRVFCICCRLLTGRTVTDNTSGFRAYGREALKFSACNYPSFDYPEPEEVILLLRNGFHLKEVPVEMKERQSGRSSIDQFQAVYYMVKVVFAVLMASVRAKIRKG